MTYQTYIKRERYLDLSNDCFPLALPFLTEVVSSVAGRYLMISRPIPFIYSFNSYRFPNFSR